MERRSSDRSDTMQPGLAGAAGQRHGPAWRHLGQFSSSLCFPYSMLLDAKYISIHSSWESAPEARTCPSSWYVYNHISRWYVAKSRI